jgi:hypothetical protein
VHRLRRNARHRHHRELVDLALAQAAAEQPLLDLCLREVGVLAADREVVVDNWHTEEVAKEEVRSLVAQHAVAVVWEYLRGAHA